MPTVTATRQPRNSRKLNISVNFINTCGESVVGCDSTWIALAYQLQLKQFSRRWSSQSKSAIRNISRSPILGLIFPKIAFLITFHTKLWGKSSIQYFNLVILSQNLLNLHHSTLNFLTNVFINVPRKCLFLRET